jgi:hypothetical protein
MKLERINRGSAAALGFIIVSVIFAVLAVGVKLSQSIPAVDADRGAERSKALAEMQAAEEQGLKQAAVIDAPRGVVRLPINRAMEMAAAAWKNPAAARADLNARAEKAAAALPKVPEKPSAFE